MILILNTVTGSLSTYNNYPFNSFFNIGNRYFGVASTGIYELTGDSDNGVVINMSIKTARMDFGTPTIKNIRDIYLKLKTDGDYQIILITHDNKSYTYNVLDNDLIVHTQRVKTGQGARGRHWEIVIKNLNNSLMEIHSIDINNVETTRRIIPR